MKRPIYCYVQRLDTTAAFWLTQTLQGIEAFAAEKRMRVEFVSREKLPRGQWVMLVGSEQDWQLRESSGCSSPSGLCNTGCPGSSGS